VLDRACEGLGTLARRFQHDEVRPLEFELLQRGRSRDGLEDVVGGPEDAGHLAERGGVVVDDGKARSVSSGFAGCHRLAPSWRLAAATLVLPASLGGHHPRSADSLPLMTPPDAPPLPGGVPHPLAHPVGDELPIHLGNRRQDREHEPAAP